MYNTIASAKGYLFSEPPQINHQKKGQVYKYNHNHRVSPPVLSILLSYPMC